MSAAATVFDNDPAEKFVIEVTHKNGVRHFGYGDDLGATIDRATVANWGVDNVVIWKRSDAVVTTFNGRELAVYDLLQG